MPSSYTTSLRFEAQLTGENLNTWGALLSNTLARVDDAIAGYLSIPITGNYSITAANTNASADEARRAHLKFTGTLASNATITIPSVSKAYWIWNATNRTLTITTGSGSTYAIEAGDKLPVWCDGTNVNGVAFGSYNLKDYIAAQVLASSTALPGQVGNAGKFLKTDGATATWQQAATTDLSDYQTAIVGLQVAMAVAL
jgi:hypothetical protein